MRRGVAWLTRALAIALLAGAATAQAQVAITIDDARVRERSTGPWAFQLAVRLPGPPSTDVMVDWAVVSGSATAGTDFTAVPPNGTLLFPALVNAPQYVDIQIEGDVLDEWSPTLMQDEVFFVQLSNPSANAYLYKGRGTVTLLDDDHPNPGVQFLTAVTGGTNTLGQSKLQWRVPAGPVSATDVVIRWKTGAPCSFPTSTTDGTGGVSTGTPPGPGQVQTWIHPSAAPNTTYCYSVFSIFGATPTTEIAKIEASTFDATGPVVWRYYTGSASVVPPTVGADAIYTVDNRGVVHAMQRGASGGAWPAFTWNPVAVGKPTQNRSAAVPVNGPWRLFLGTDGGGVHSIDAKFGNIVWSRSTDFANALPNQGGVQAQPAGLFKAFGGNNDMLLVGTNAVTNLFYALDPQTGGTIASFPHASMGAVNGMAVVDYAANRVYFGTSSSSGTLFALDLGPSGTPGLALSAGAWNPKPMGTGTMGSAVLRNDTLYLGDSSGQIHALRVTGATPGVSYSVGTGDGVAKGFLWPDRRDDRLYFATDGQVQAVRDDGSALNPIWQVPVQTPSMVLQWPGTDYLYVGDGNGRLLQIQVTDQTWKPVVLEAGSQIGAPSLDGANGIVLVGSSTGTIYAVRVPLP